ncbi:hypothetical protein ES702_00689 [subsurface metagenome]
MSKRKKMDLMYPFVADERPNPLGGKCYECGYCYIHGKKGMKIRFKRIRDKYSGDFRLYPKILERISNIRSDKPVFFCDCIDYLHENNSIENILEIFYQIENNRYGTMFLSVTKNPLKYSKVLDSIPDNLILGFTTESNRDYPFLSNAPLQSERNDSMLYIRGLLDLNNIDNKMFISIEPIMEFDFYEFINIIDKINPTFGVAIGYDNHHHKLIEPILRNTLVLRKYLIARKYTVFDKSLRKAHWEKR